MILKEHSIVAAKGDDTSSNHDKVIIHLVGVWDYLLKIDYLFRKLHVV